MLIPLAYLYLKYDMKITGILHVGAHGCEEDTDYFKHGVLNENIFWIEAMPHKVEEIKLLHPTYNIYQAVINDVDNQTINFNIATNGQSSSILEFGTHSAHHPHVKFMNKIELTTTRLDTLIEKHDISINVVNFINLDIQGVELNALKSMEKYLIPPTIEYIYTEVNTEHVYKDCALIGDIDEYLGRFGFARVETNMYLNCGWGDAFYIRKKMSGSASAHE